MATTVTEIWSDLNHQLVVDARGGIKKDINVDAVKTSINNILRTRFGERVMHPEFGSNIDDILFENMSSAMLTSLSSDIENAINDWDNRVIVKSVVVKTYPDQNSVDINVMFSVRGYDKVFEYTVS
jgi:hypothetical protein